MKRLTTILFAAIFALGLTLSHDADAGRLGGGKSFGTSRNSAPMKQAPTAAPASPAQNAAPAAPRAPGAAPAPSGMSRWMGPIAGLAAGLGIAALLSHFGLGEGVANFVMIALLVFAAIFVIRLLFRKKQPEGQAQYAGAGAPFNQPTRFEPQTANVGTAAAGVAANVPADFDVEGFLRQAKLNFTRLQAANDRGDMDDVKAFTTPEVFAEIKMQYDERGRTAQQTDVVQLNANLIEVVTEGNRHIASVRFFGQLRENVNDAPQPFDEAWHLAKPTDGSGGWLVAGIQQF